MTSKKVNACRRCNHVHAAYVEAAIRLTTLTSVRQAEDMLIREGVPREVIARVLLLKGPYRLKRE
jgi:hypothetical protein